jgi:hypothetical protein
MFNNHLSPQIIEHNVIGNPGQVQTIDCQQFHQYQQNQLELLTIILFELSFYNFVIYFNYLNVKALCLIIKKWLKSVMSRQQLIVSSSTNINKTNNHLSPQIIEHNVIGNPGQVQTIDCQQFHQYQQNQHC